MRDFKSNRGNRGGRRSDQPQMYKAVCDECGDECRVPFRPSGDKPIYCNECYEQHGGSSSNNFDKGRRGRSFDRRDSRRGRDGGRSAMYAAQCDECGKECQLPFKPRGDKPVYCSECFESKGGGKNRGGRDGGRKVSRPSVDSDLLVSINDKLQTIIDLMSGNAETKEVPAEERKVKEDEKVGKKKVVKKKRAGKKKI